MNPDTQQSILQAYFHEETFENLLAPKEQAKPEKVRIMIESINTMMGDFNKNIISYTQLRNILQLVKNDVFPKDIAAFYKILPKLAYIEGRLPPKKADHKGRVARELVEFIRELGMRVENEEQYEVFIDIMNSIVAYHKLNN